MTKLFSNKDLKRLILPLMVEQLLGTSVGMFDTMMISVLGESAVSGVSLVDMLNVLMFNIFSALATGGAVICAHEVGRVRAAHDEERGYPDARRAAKHLLLVVLTASVVIALAAYILRVQFLRLCFGAIEADVMEHALTYFIISCISYPFIAVYGGLAALFRTMGDSRMTMVASTIMNIVNILGNALLIYGVKMGVSGAAWATTFSRFVGMMILLVLIFDKKRDIFLDLREKFRFEPGTVRRILRIGIPNSLENSVFQLGRILVISMIAGFGTIQLAANSVANNLDSLGCIPGHAMCLAMITVVGQCIGAGDYEQALYYEKKLLKISYLSTAVIETAIILTLPLSLRLYDLSPETLKLAAILIILHDGFAIFLWTPSFTTPNALRAAQDVRFTMIVSIFSMVFFRILFTYIIGVRMGFGIIGVWIAMLFDWLFRAILFTHRVHSGRWLRNLPQKQ